MLVCSVELHVKPSSKKTFESLINFGGKTGSLNPDRRSSSHWHQTQSEPVYPLSMANFLL